MWLTHAAAVLRNHEEQRRLHELAVAAAPAAAASHAQHSAQAASGPVQEPVLPPLPPPPLDALLAELRVTGSNGGGAAGSAASAALVQTLQQLQLLPPYTAAAAQPGSVPSASRSASTATATAGTVLTTQPTFSNASTLSQSTIPSRTAPQPAAAPSHDSGMLDMSAFGGFGAFDSFSGSKSEQAETQMPSMSQGLGGQPSISAGSVTLRRGMGESIHNSMAQPATGSTAPAAASAQDSSMLTGMLDMSAFGIDMGPPSPPQEPAAQPPPAAAVGGSSMMSGMIDMSAFGMAGFDFPSGQMEPPAQPPTPPPITPPPASAVHDPDLPLAALKALRKQEQQATATASTQGKIWAHSHAPFTCHVQSMHAASMQCCAYTQTGSQGKLLCKCACVTVLVCALCCMQGRPSPRTVPLPRQLPTAQPHHPPPHLHPSAQTLYSTLVHPLAHLAQTTA